MSGITDAAVEKYLYGLLPERDPVLAEMEKQARRRDIPIVGPAVGRLLHQYAQLIGARRIFEMGSALGLIFTDGDKHDYPEVFRLAVPRLRRGGLFITDNVFWSGRVARKAADKNTRAIQEFNRLLYSSPDLWTTLLPLRDGLAVCLKS